MTARSWRYLRRIRTNEFLGLEKTVAYLDEIFVHTNYTVSNYWQSEDVQGYIIVHVEGSYRYVEGTLLIYKSKSKGGYHYHNDMNHDNFITWLRVKLIPNLPKNGIVMYLSIVSK